MPKLEFETTRNGTVAIVRLEELYPFPSAELAETLDRYPGVVDVVWLQEEPRNMGAWAFVQPRIQAILARHSLELRYVGRPERASPAEGSPSWHAAEQQRIVSEAFAGLDRLGAPRATVKAAPAAPVASGATRVTS
jgi:2-oxoglutarate dehydrogenase E1 component